MADTKKTTTKSNTNGASAKEVKELKAENKELRDQMLQMQQMILSLQQTIAASGAAVTPVVTPVPVQMAPAEKSSLLDEVTLVHLVQRAPGLTTHMEISNLQIDMNAFGELRTLDRRQAEELAGKYRRFFDQGIIAFGDGCEDIARRFNLKVVKDYNLGKDFISRLGTMSVGELEDLYMSLGQGHRAFIIEYFKRQILAKDPKFNNPQKIEMLNRVSHGAMSGVILDSRREEEARALQQK